LVLGDDVMCDLRVSGQPLTTDGNVCPHSLSRVFLMFECFSLLRISFVNFVIRCFSVDGFWSTLGKVCLRRVLDEIFSTKPARLGIFSC
jgi:hypothetical protein